MRLSRVLYCFYMVFDGCYNVVRGFMLLYNVLYCFVYGMEMNLRGADKVLYGLRNVAYGFLRLYRVFIKFYIFVISLSYCSNKV